MKNKTAGRDPSCDLVCEHETVSRYHARIELAENGQVSIVDSGSRNGTFLNRNDTWIRIRKVTLCIGDQVRFGEHPVPLEHLTAVFGKRSKARLEARRFPLRHGARSNRAFAEIHDAASMLQNPRRNPTTGKIEEDHAE